jgi:hypothetical protein
VLDGILLEKAGIPAVSIVTEPFRVTGEEMAGTWGVPGYKFLDMPHPIANLSDAALDEQADRLLESVIGLMLSLDA